MAESDVIIVGAGAAGLAAAGKLAAWGRRVVILEARSRTGGRVFTRQCSGLPFPVELGAEFIHGLPQETFSIVRAANLVTYETSDTHLLVRDGKIQDENAAWDRMAQLLDRVDELASTGRSVRSFLDGPGSVDAQAALLLRRYVEGYHAAHTERMSLAALAQAERAAAAIGGDRSFRVLNGYSRVVDALISARPGIELRLNTRVDEVVWETGRVVLHATNALSGGRESFTAPRVLVTLPLSVLQAGSVRFDPPLVEKSAAAARLHMGNVVKVVLQFAEPVWEAREEMHELGFLHAPDQLFPTWWTMHPLRSSVITGWAGGPAADGLNGKSREAMLECALHSLAQSLSIPHEQLTRGLLSAHLHDWLADPFSGGAYSYIPVGGEDAPAELGRPLHGTLFFAGEATDTTGHTGTVHGAIASGYRAAAEMLAD